VLSGRQSDCDVSLTESRKVSRRHCCLAQVNNQILARDLGSTNGIFLNGERVKRECRLKLGDELMIGDLKFRLQNDPNPPVPKPVVAKLPPTKPVKAERASQTPMVDPFGTFSSKPTPFVRGVPGGELPSMDIPVILPEEDLDFAVEPSLARMPQPRAESGPLVPYLPPRKADSEGDVIPLGTDSGI